jgi:phage FluMu protein Com
LRLCAEVVKIEKVRCARCGQTLLLAEYVKGEIKCPRCKTINRLDIKMTEPRAAPKE